MDRLEIIEEWASLDATFDEVVKQQILLVAEAAGVTPERVAIAISASHEPDGGGSTRTRWWSWRFR